MKESLSKALISLDINDKEECPKIDPFGLCTVKDCLCCDNCEYMIVMGDDEVLKRIINEDLENKYLVEFFDAITSDMFQYLIDESNDYRITRISDGVVLRYSNAELIEMGCEPRVKQNNLNNQVFENKSLVKRFTDRFINKKTSY